LSPVLYKNRVGISREATIKQPGLVSAVAEDVDPVELVVCTFGSDESPAFATDVGLVDWTEVV
jgi:hypothetical protein